MPPLLMKKLFLQRSDRNDDRVSIRCTYIDRMIERRRQRRANVWTANTQTKVHVLPVRRTNIEEGTTPSALAGRSKRMPPNDKLADVYGALWRKKSLYLWVKWQFEFRTFFAVFTTSKFASLLLFLVRNTEKNERRSFRK